MTVTENGDRIMYDAPVGSHIYPRVDVRIIFPDNGVIRIESARLFADPEGLLCRRFVGRVFLAPEIDSAVIACATAEGVTPAVGEECWVLLENDKGKFWTASLIEHGA